MQSQSELILNELSKLKEIAKQDVCIVVEGCRDEQALRDFGIECRYYHVSGSGKSIHALAEQISAEREAIILTDFDKKGAILASKIVEQLHLAPDPVKVNLAFRRNLMNAMKETKAGEVHDLVHLVGGHDNGKDRRSSNKVHNKGKAHHP